MSATADEIHALAIVRGLRAKLEAERKAKASVCEAAAEYLNASCGWIVATHSELAAQRLRSAIICAGGKVNG